MKTISLKFGLGKGLHAKDAVQLFEVVQNATSKVTISANDKTADLKNILSVLSLSIKYKDVVKIEIFGKDEQEIYYKLRKYLINRAIIEDKKKNGRAKSTTKSTTKSAK